MLRVISTDEFKKEVFDYTTGEEWKFDKSKPIILNFYADWCGPCQMFSPTLEEIASEHGSKLQVFKINIDTDPEIPELFGIRSVPTTLFLNPNEEPVMAMGAIPKDSVVKAISEIFKL